jgi:hypothetical protein
MPTCVVSLEREAVRLREGFDVWRADGKLILRTMSMRRVLARRASYFRVNQSGKVFELVSRQKSVELPAGSIEWR